MLQPPLFLTCGSSGWGSYTSVTSYPTRGFGQPCNSALPSLQKIILFGPMGWDINQLTDLRKLEKWSLFNSQTAVSNGKTGENKEVLKKYHKFTIICNWKMSGICNYSRSKLKYWNGFSYVDLNLEPGYRNYHRNLYIWKISFFFCTFLKTEMRKRKFN